VALGHFIAGQFFSGLVIAALLITLPYSSPLDLASSILVNDKALWDKTGFGMNWAVMNHLAMNCASPHSNKRCLIHNPHLRKI
jgi:hypothetical protein